MTARTALTLLLLACTSTPASAQEVFLRLPGCEAAPARRDVLRAALQLELASGGYRLTPQPTAAGWRIELARACERDARRPQLRVQAPDASTRTRDIDLADTPSELHARTLALATAEALRAHAGQPAAPSRTALELLLEPTWRAYLARRDSLFGAELSLRIGNWVLGLDGLLGVFADTLGNVSAGEATASLTYAWPVLQAGDFSMSVGPRVAAGALWARTDASLRADAGSLLTITWDAGAVLAARYSFGDWALGLRCGGGYARGARVQADARTVAELTGSFVSAAVSISVRLR